ncbi:MAG TPA: glycosyltransferase family 4 protein [Gemmatimonadaceae bacterium]|jgi:glycosyltransferase involved in cell wall biosynthesis
MKVLMTADAVGGVWSYALELARALAPRGVEIVLATMGPRPSALRREEAARCRNVRLETSDFRLEWMQSPWTDVARAGEWLLALEQREHPDLVHLNGYVHAALPWHAPVCVVAHSCSCSWWRAVKHEPAPESWDRYRAAVRKGLDSAAIVIAPTCAMLDALTTEYGHVEHTRVIYNARRASEYPVLEKERLVLTAGRMWDEAKNVSALGCVAPSIEWPVYVAGESAMPGFEGMEPTSCCSLGPIEHGALARWMGRASIYASPARYEPFGLSVLEAALAGCALVLGDIPSLRELWRDAALFVDPDDHDQIAYTLQRLIADGELRHTIARRCRTRAFAFDPREMASGYLHAYESALAGAGAWREERRCAS